jgi:hypothetical protein
MTKLCPRGKAAAKRKFKVYPSAYANAYASKICAGKIKDPSGVRRKDFRGPKPASQGAMMNVPKGKPKNPTEKFNLENTKSKIKFGAKKMVKAKQGAYIGSFIKSDIDGKKISNKSYEKYYKGMI